MNVLVLIMLNIADFCAFLISVFTMEVPKPVLLGVPLPVPKVGTDVLRERWLREKEA